MEYLTIGFIIGSVLGLTGSGGALVAIPLFMSVNLSIKEASLLSLLAVVIAGILNLLQSYKLADTKKVFLMIAFSILGSFIFIPVKAMTPSSVIKVLLTLISIYSLYSMWKVKKKTSKPEFSPPLWITALVGFFLGGLTTLTGLGGGILLMPIFVGFFRMPMPIALATSLLTIVGSSLVSFSLQFLKGARLAGLGEIGLLVIGMFVSTLLLREVVKRISADRTDLIRKIVFTLIVIFAMVKFYF